MLVKLQKILYKDETSPTLENLKEMSLAYKSIFTDTLVLQVTQDCLMMYQLH